MSRLRFIARFIITLVLLAALSGGIASLPAGKAQAFSGSGAGSAGDPYQITSWEQLNEVRNYLDSHFILMNDLGPGDTGYGDYNSGDGWEPIGTSATRFTGTFDGGGHTISGLFINRPDTWYVGMFGYVSGGTVKNVGLIDVDITGKQQVGGLVGRNDGGTVSNSYATGSVAGTGPDVGGLVGYNLGGTITDSYATGSVTGTSDVGGLVGYNNGGTITTSYATGSVTGGCCTGGLVGFNTGTVTDSYATGSVTGTSRVGGLVGSNVGGTITTSYAMGSVTGTDDYVGGLVGLNTGTITNSFWDTVTSGQGTSAGGTGKTTADMKDQSTFTSWDFTTTWAMSSTISFYGYPTLQWTGAYAEEPTDNEIASLPNLVWVAENSDRWDGTYTQTADISMWTTPGWDAGAGWTPIGNSTTQFTGEFDGDGHTISGLFINRPDTDNVGLFGSVSGGTVKNVTLSGIDITGKDQVGGLVGYTSTSAPATISDSHATGDVSGVNDVGGLVGYNDGDTILRSSASGNVVGTSNRVGGLVGRNSEGTVEESYATGNVAGNNNVGGLVGFNVDGGTVSDSYATGSVTGTGNAGGGLVGYNHGGTVTNSYAAGSVTGASSVGGLVGSNVGTVTDSFYDTDTTGRNDDAGKGEPKTTDEMKDIATFTDAEWSIGTSATNLNNGYPFLSWQIGNSPTWLIYVAPPPAAGGGADWGWIPGPSMGLTLVGASGQWEISSEGRILSDGYLTSADGSVTVFIPYLTKLLGPDGTPIDEISVTPIDPPPAPEGMHILAAFDFQPDGATFDRDGIQIIISFDPSAMAPGDTLAIAFFNEATGAWEFIEGTVNPDGTATFNVHHFTVFAVMSGTPVVSTAPEKAPEPTAEAVELSAPAVTGDASGGLGSTAWIGLAVGIITLLGIAWLLKYRRRSA